MQVGAQIPRGKPGVEPDAAPTEKGGIDIRPVVANQAFTQAAVFIRFDCHPDAVSTFRFCEHVRCEHSEST